MPERPISQLNGPGLIEAVSIITNSARASLTREEDIRTVFILAGWLKAKIALEISRTISLVISGFLYL